MTGTTRGDRPSLVLHIGLPKTATTWLQATVFPRAQGIALVHRKQGPEERAICESLRGFAHSGAILAALHQWRLVRRLRALTARGQPLLVTDENVSLLARGFWTGKGTDPARLARRLASLTSAFRLKVIVGIRRQDQWLASRYAESAKHFPEFSQTDFDRRIAAIAAAPGLDGPLGWLDHALVHQAFVAAVGAENLLLLPLEGLGPTPGAAFAELGRFIGDPDLTASPAPAKRRRAANRLSRGENLWQMRKGGHLRLDPELQARLLDRFAASNAAVAPLVAGTKEG